MNMNMMTESDGIFIQVLETVWACDSLFWKQNWLLLK